MNFSGTTALITGGTGALGSVCAEEFYGTGLNVVVSYRSEADRGAGARHHPADDPRYMAVHADLTEERDVERLCARVVERYGRLDYLVHTAGGYAGGPTVGDLTVDELEEMFRVNVKTAFLACRQSLRLMRAQGFGRIVTFAAMPALSPSVGRAAYAVAKRAVVTLTETIAEEGRGTGVTANAIAPSIILTDANRRSMPAADTDGWVAPQEIAALAMFLCSDEARSVNGNVIKIYGGVGPRP